MSRQAARLRLLSGTAQGARQAAQDAPHVGTDNAPDGRARTPQAANVPRTWTAQAERLRRRRRSGRHPAQAGRSPWWSYRNRPDAPTGSRPSQVTGRTRREIGRTVAPHYRILPKITAAVFSGQQSRRRVRRDSVRAICRAVRTVRATMPPTATGQQAQPFAVATVPTVPPTVTGSATVPTVTGNRQPRRRSRVRRGDLPTGSER